MLFDFKFWPKRDLAKYPHLWGIYLRTPHIGRTKASDVACPAPSPPLLSPNFSPITTTTNLASPHQISSLRSPIRCRPDCSFRFFPLSYLSLRFRFREEPLRWDSVMCSADQIRFRYRSQFFFEIQIRDEILSATAIADVCRLRGRSIRRTKFSAAQALAGKVALGASRNGSCSWGRKMWESSAAVPERPTNQMAGCDNGQWEI